mgnify:CR=1 FL=1
MEKQFDFSGWATKANVKCSDGRIITKDAFKHNDGQTIPLVWNHKHGEVTDVLGHALLENREEGVYAYCKFNDTENGKTARLLVQHGDVDQLSIYANQLKQQGPYVMHGNIRELSLVLAGANPEAFIENITMMHGEDSYELEDEVRIFTGEYISLSHADLEEEEEDDDEEVKNDEVEEKKSSKKESDKVESEEEPDTDDKDDEIEHSAESENEKGDSKMAEVKEGRTIKEIIDSLGEEEQKAVFALVGMALEDAGAAKHSDIDDEYEGGDEFMKHNVFEQDELMNEQALAHAALMADVIGDIQRFGSLKESALQHGIENIGEFFPEAKTTGEIPDLLKRNDGWVAKVLNGVHRTPFAKIKTMYADITADEARAKGYVKGNLKVEEVIKAFKRTTSPTTVYKKQKLDRDDIIDITDFDVIAFLKAEMRLMLEEEVARAILIGDGRELDDNDHIDEESIRPIWTDNDVYTVKQTVAVAANATADEKAKAFIRACVKSRKQYKGSGSPVMYMSEDILTDCLLIEDTNGRRIYETIDKLASALTVKEIVPVTVMDNVTRKVDEATHTLAGIYVNLNDYNIGADKGGAINMFDDFDIDYNQNKYLIETRCSGALTKPSAAVAIEFVNDSAQG